MQNIQLESTVKRLYKDSEKDYLRMVKGVAKSIFRPMQPSDFKDAYLAISYEQGKDLVDMIKTNKLRKIVEFGTSFGISTLFLAQGVKETGGRIVTTELIESKAHKAIENFKSADVNDLIEVRIGNAMETLKNYDEPIDLLLLDGWKDLYQPLFQLLEPNFHSHTIVYVDNADMRESQLFLRMIAQDARYQLDYKYSGKVALITLQK